MAHILEIAYIELKKNLASLGIVEYLRYSEYNEKCWSHLIVENRLGFSGIAVKNHMIVKVNLLTFISLVKGESEIKPHKYLVYIEQIV